VAVPADPFAPLVNSVTEDESTSGLGVAVEPPEGTGKWGDGFGVPPAASTVAVFSDEP
jgi:hypothetical protein